MNEMKFRHYLLIAVSLASAIMVFKDDLASGRLSASGGILFFLLKCLMLAMIATVAALAMMLADFIVKDNDL